VRSGDNWIVTARKIFITHAIHADTCVAFASTDRSQQSKGITAFVFEKGMKGFTPSKKENKLGLRAQKQPAWFLKIAMVPDENRLGEEGAGIRERHGDSGTAAGSQLPLSQWNRAGCL